MWLDIKWVFVNDICVSTPKNSNFNDQKYPEDFYFSSFLMKDFIVQKVIQVFESIIFHW